ncbi:ribonuclease J [Nitrospirota bacterium]
MPVKDLEKLKVIPLGGVEEIGGLNMTVYEYGEDIVVVDAGLMFPEDDMLGVDFVIQDFTYLLDNRERVKGIILTHGHEDHTGSLPFLLKEINVPVYGTALTLGLVQEKLREHNIKNLSLHRIKPRDSFELGAFKVEFIRITHSIVDGVALAIRTPVGVVIHTGDFKIDPTPVDGELLDFNSFTRYGEEGVLLMLSDSTNAERGGFTFSEKEVRRAFEDIFAITTGRIIISTFSSNIHRLQQAIDVAAMFGRKVVICGRSMVNNSQIALDLGYMKMPKETWLEVDALKNLPDEEVLILTTGSQGEPMSVLSRIAIGEHKHIKIKDGDTIVISAKAIPGNERSIGKLINRLFRLGANVIHEKVSEIHVSGHASKEELKLMYNMVRPKYFVPVHGEYRHLVSHARMLNRQGHPKDNTFLLKNGDILEVGPDSAEKSGQVSAGRVYIDGKGIGDVEEMVLRDRRRLGHDGIVLVMLTIDKEYGKLASAPDIITKGFIHEDDTAGVIDTIQEIVTETIEGLDREVTTDPSLLQAKIRARLKKHFRNTLQRRPMIMPLIFEV